MAGQQVIVSVLADVSRFSKRMRSLGSSFLQFGKMALLTTAAIGIGLAKLGSDLIRVAEDSQKANLRLDNIAKSMGLFGKRAQVVSDRLKEYARTQSLATGVDDEAIKATQAKLLTFSELARSAGTLGGAFDRATQAALDLAAAGFGTAENNAVQLGKALQDPIKGISSLTEVGLTFTEAEKRKIAALVESNKMLEAQDIILKAIEKQVGGTAEATASASSKIKTAFENIGEELGTVLLPYVEEVATAFSNWLGDKKTKQFFDDIKKGIDNFVIAMTEAFQSEAVQQTFSKLSDDLNDFFEYLGSKKGRKDMETLATVLVEGFADITDAIRESFATLIEFANFLRDFSQFNEGWADNLRNWSNSLFPDNPNWKQFDLDTNSLTNPNLEDRTIFDKTNSKKILPSVIVNFNTPVDSVSAGREIVRAIDSYTRVKGLT